MLDECKGDRLEEVLAVFSNAVLKKVLQIQGASYEALAQQLALENFSYSGERTILSALIVAHKASLSKHLRGKEDTRARYHDFSDLLNLNDRRIARRHEQLKQAIKGNQFYGDFFSKEQVPLQGEGINSIRWEWLRNVVLNPNRVHNSYRIMKKFFTDDQVVSFYKNFLDNPNFSKSDLDRLLKMKVQHEPESANTLAR